MIRTACSYGLFGLLAVLLFARCGDGDFRPEAIGPEGEITVVIDSSRWDGPVGEAIRSEIGRNIMTLPGNEPAFDLKPVSITSQRQFEELKKFRNLVVVAPLSDSTNEANFLRSILSEEARQAIQGGGSAVVPRSDVWRRRQQVVYVTANSPEGLVATIREDGERIRDRFNQVTRERLYREMFDRGRQEDLEKQLMETHGFAVNVQHDYFIAIDTTNFVWLRRVLADTWRSLFVYYEENADPGDLTLDWVYATRDSLSQIYLQGSVEGFAVTIDTRRTLETKEINFLDRYALETRGLWVLGQRNEEGALMVDGGGPFVNYSFYDQPSGRLYMIDGMVFAPSFEKREFLRQMEVIAHTFRTHQEAETAQVAAR